MTTLFTAPRIALTQALAQALALALALAVVGTALGCKRKSHAPSVEKRDAAVLVAKQASQASVAPVSWVVPAVRLEVHAVQTEERELDVEALARRIGAGLRASDYFVADSRDTPAAHSFARATVAGRLSYDVVANGSDGSSAVIVALELALVPLDSDHLAVTDNVIVERIIDPRESKADIDVAIELRAVGAIDTSVSGLIAKERLRAAPRNELAKAITGPPDIAIWALDLVAHRREVDLLDPVVAQFRSRDPRLVSAAISAAVALGEPSAVSPMADLADFQDYEQLRVIIEASSALGGSDAIEFLEFVATGHPDEAIKQHATEALGRLRP